MLLRARTCAHKTTTTGANARSSDLPSEKAAIEDACDDVIAGGLVRGLDYPSRCLPTLRASCIEKAVTHAFAAAVMRQSRMLRGSPAIAAALR